MTNHYSINTFFNHYLTNQHFFAMKKTLLLVLAAIGLAAMSLNAQTSLSLSFNRTGTSISDVSVLSSGIDGVSASLSSASHAFKPSAGAISSAILCPNVNANTNPTISLSFTISNFPANRPIESVDLDIHALNGASNYQENNDGQDRQWNVSITSGATALGSQSNIDIARGVGSLGNVHRAWSFTPAVPASIDSPAVVTITVTKGSVNGGCFFGLSNITFHFGEVIDPDLPSEPDIYCIPTATITDNYRYLTQFTLTGEDGTSVTIPTHGGADNRPVYKDATSTVFVARQGEEIQVMGEGSDSEWAGQWLYIDFAGDGFNASEIEVNPDFSSKYGNDLVTYNSLKAPDEDTFYNALGHISAGNVTLNTEDNERSHIPSFNIPGYLAPGDYRARYILQYNSLNPCGNFDSEKSDDHITNGGCIVDFTIRVELSDFTAQEVHTGEGDVVISSGITSQGEPSGIIYDGSQTSVGGTTLHAFVNHAENYDVESIVLANGIWHGADITVDASEFETLPNGMLHYQFLLAADAELAVEFVQEVLEISDIIEAHTQAPARYFNIHGMEISAEHLVPGIYIKSSGGKSIKVLLK